MKLMFLVGFVITCSCFYNVAQGFPHQSTEESDDPTDVEIVIVTHPAGTDSDITSSEKSRESHEFKSREDRGSVSESDEPNPSDDDPIVAEDVAKFAEDDSKMADEEARTSVYHPKMAETEPILAEAKSNDNDDDVKAEMPRRVPGFPKLSEVDRKFAAQPAKKVTVVPKKVEVATKTTEDRVESISEEEVEDKTKMSEQEPTTVDNTSKDFGGLFSLPKFPESDTKSPEEAARSPVYHPKMTEVEPKTAEEEPKGAEDDAKGTEEEESDEDDATVKFPKAGSCPICPKGAATSDKTESLCPARPEEMTKIEAECAEEFKQWKEMRAKKFEVDKTTTTLSPSTSSSVVMPITSTELPSIEATVPETPDSLEAVEPAYMESTTNEITERQISLETTSGGDSTDSGDEVDLDVPATTTQDYIPIELEAEELPETDVPLIDPTTTPLPPSTTTSSTTTTSRMTTTIPWMTTTMRPIRRSGKQKRSSRKVTKKRSCYPATCILRKLNLLDSMGQPSIERIQSFAINMTVDGSTNLEQKAVACVKEINEAMIDASGDIGKKVGCVAQKVITCLNKGLSCPIMKVAQ